MVRIQIALFLVAFQKSHAHPSDVTEKNDRETFLSWATTFRKEYRDAQETSERFLTWVSNHELIEEHNNQDSPPSYLLGHNQFSDLTNDEFQKMNRLGEYNLGFPSHELNVNAATVAEKARILSDSLPETVNWVEEGAVTEVKNQGQCGSCWAFSAAAALESAKYLSSGELVNLSVQELIDCDHKDSGCLGGYMDNAFTYVENKGGICSWTDYSYKPERVAPCKQCQSVPGTTINYFVDVYQTEFGLMEAIAQQPVSVGIHASQVLFQFYKSGVYDRKCPPQTDHGVLAVGYGKEEETGETYWLIKNSWGAEWGEHGYIKIARSSEDRDGRCGIYRIPSYPVLM